MTETNGAVAHSDQNGDSEAAETRPDPVELLTAILDKDPTDPGAREGIRDLGKVTKFLRGQIVELSQAHTHEQPTEWRSCYTSSSWPVVWAFTVLAAVIGGAAGWYFCFVRYAYDFRYIVGTYVYTNNSRWAIMLGLALVLGVIGGLVAYRLTRFDDGFHVPTGKPDDTITTSPGGSTVSPVEDPESYI